MILALCAIIIGLIVLAFSADRFVEGASAAARHFGMPPLLIGMLVIGFGTSAPEMMVSALSASQGNPGLALGNAYGSNITNIALILGLTALISPITVASGVLRKELPILTGITAFSVWQISDGMVSRTDAWMLLGVFGALMTWSIMQGIRNPQDTLNQEMQEALSTSSDASPVTAATPLRTALVSLVLGLAFLTLSSRMLVWGAVEIAQGFGISDLIIGLTIVAIGTSLPELASSLAATRKGEHDIAFGNVVGSNLFNTLAVVGIAGAIQPMQVDPAALHRDALCMGLLTLSLFVFGSGLRGPGRITRVEGAVLLSAYVGYNAYLARTVLSGI